MWAVVASGPSLTQEQVDVCKRSKVFGRLSGIVAVSNVALDFLPDADAIVSHDAKWWDAHPKALDLKPTKYCRTHKNGTKVFVPTIKSGCNSGFMAMDVAHRIYGAKSIILLGFDMHGEHYFGKYGEGLRNTTPERFQEHIRQFNFWDGCPVINCTPNSSLKKFPFMDLKDAVL